MDDPGVQGGPKVHELGFNRAHKIRFDGEGLFGRPRQKLGGFHEKGNIHIHIFQFIAPLIQGLIEGIGIAIGQGRSDAISGFNMGNQLFRATLLEFSFHKNAFLSNGLLEISFLSGLFKQAILH